MTRAVDDALLREWSLPALEDDGDKESRGRVLVVAGSREMPGAAILAGEAALRAGGGKLVVATPQSAAQTVASALTEARVVALPEAADGSCTLAGLRALQALAPATAAVLVGPGMIGEEGTIAFVRALLPQFKACPVVLDALAMDAVQAMGRFEQSIVLTPHAGEMAHLTGDDKQEVKEEPVAKAVRQAKEWNAVVALKGATTVIAAPDGQAWTHSLYAPGLGTSGSGDVLAGLVAGLLARGTAPAQALAWAVALHARAGQALARHHGQVGYLARELAPQVPPILQGLAT